MKDQNDSHNVIWVCPGCGNVMADVAYQTIKFNFRCQAHVCNYRLSDYVPKTAHPLLKPGETTDGSGELGE